MSSQQLHSIFFQWKDVDRIKMFYWLWRPKRKKNFWGDFLLMPSRCFCWLTWHDKKKCKADKKIELFPWSYQVWTKTSNGWCFKIEGLKKEKLSRIFLDMIGIFQYWPKHFEFTIRRGKFCFIMLGCTAVTNL